MFSESDGGGGKVQCKMTDELAQEGKGKGEREENV